LPGGSNLSAGEKQLISLLRALVRGCKVLIMDEATSSVDAETDAVVQRIIQREFADVTVSTIYISFRYLAGCMVDRRQGRRQDISG
jgi:ABC-type multidrug transport system fused ATPase/permease subunit